jgi:hypothetical protein
MCNWRLAKALYAINIDDAEDMSRARNEGAKEAVEAALMAHSGDQALKDQATALVLQIQHSSL